LKPFCNLRKIFFLFLCFQSLFSSFNVSAKANLKNEDYAVIVYGNELPAVAAAVMASKQLAKNGQVVLIRPYFENEPLGGLVTQGGLAYLDRNQLNSSLSPSSEFYKEFLSRAKVKRVSLDPVLADQALRQMLKDAGVKIISNAILYPDVAENEIQGVRIQGSGQVLRAKIYIDGTPNADLARRAGLQYSIGFQTLGYPNATLPVSPIIRTSGLSVSQLQAIENTILSNADLVDRIKQKLKAEHEPEFYTWLLKNFDKKMYVGEDYIDFRSIALGAAYHLYRNKPYDFKKGFLFDRPNIAILKNGDLSWNAFLYKFSAQEVVGLVNSGSKLTPEMHNELKAFEDWLHKFPEGKEAVVISPSELYIRHSLNVIDVVHPFTGREIIHGGPSASKAVGTFSYFFDVRGGIDGYSGKMLKPIFNFGIEHCLSRFDNLAVVSRSAGYFGLAPAVGRILELNASIASYVGAAAAIAVKTNSPLTAVSSAQARQAIEKLTGTKSNLSGKDLSQGVDLKRVL
jgi:hypothetical protein